MTKFLDEKGVITLWDKVKEKDNEVKSYVDWKIINKLDYTKGVDKSTPQYSRHIGYVIGIDNEGVFSIDANDIYGSPINISKHTKLELSVANGMTLNGERVLTESDIEEFNPYKPQHQELYNRTYLYNQQTGNTKTGYIWLCDLRSAGDNGNGAAVLMQGFVGEYGNGYFFDLCVYTRGGITVYGAKSGSYKGIDLQIRRLTTSDGSVYKVYIHKNTDWCSWAVKITDLGAGDSTIVAHNTKFNFSDMESSDIASSSPGYQHFSLQSFTSNDRSVNNIDYQLNNGTLTITEYVPENTPVTLDEPQEITKIVYKKVVKPSEDKPSVIPELKPEPNEQERKMMEELKAKGLI